MKVFSKLKTAIELQQVESTSGSAASRKGAREQKLNPMTQHPTNTLVDQYAARILGQAK